MLLQRFKIVVPPGVTKEHILAHKALVTLEPVNDWSLHFIPRTAPPPDFRTQ